jgi:cytosine/adenosine deaminase-related metal-dependent hydrolase
MQQPITRGGDFMPDSLLITHGNTFTLGQRNEQIPDGAIYVEGDTIVEVGPTASLTAKYPGAARLDAGGKIVLPASICGHTHFYGAFARGMAIPGHQLPGNPGATLVETRPGAAVG